MFENEINLNNLKLLTDPNFRHKAIENLYQNNIPLVLSICKKYKDLPIDFDEMKAVGHHGLYKAIITFETNLNTKFATYATRCITNEIFLASKRWNMSGHKNEFVVKSLQETVSSDSDLTFMDQIEDERNSIEEKMLRFDEKNVLKKIVDEMDEKTRQVLIKNQGLFNNEAQTLKEIAKQIGISRTSAGLILKKAKETIRIKMGEYYNDSSNDQEKQ